ncbi:MAG: septal ring lytic transglycosylase RlpA family protein [Limnohabitans sp.]
MKHGFFVGVLWCGMAAAIAAEVEADVRLASAPESAETSTDSVQAPDETFLQEGLATWYGGKRWHGRRTASGERFDRHGLTAAHLNLPLGSTVRVVNQHNGREVLVRINDRGPFAKNFIIDLSEAAAERLGMRHAGRAPVSLHHSSPQHPPSR